MAKKAEKAITNDSGSERPQSPQNKEANSVHSFHPSQINLQTFRDLLSCYEATVSQKHRRKAVLKLQSKAKGALKSKAGKKSDAISTTTTKLDASEEQQIREETDKFLELDRWRYEVLPKIVEERKVKDGHGEGSEVEGTHLLREELVDIMDWKMKHGVFRPALLGMVKSNQDKTVTKSTSTAFAALPDADPMLAPSEAFPKASLDALTAPLRGVGPATASLILSIGTILDDSKRQVPFYSDDVYLWLVLGDFPNAEDQVDKKSSHKKPNGELIAKYDINEYRDLWKCTHELCERLNKDIAEHDRPVALIDIEKVAYVIRNIADSGYRDSRSSRTVPQGLDIGSEQEDESDKAKKHRLKEEKSDKVERRESKRLKQ